MKRASLILGVVLILSMVLGACTPAATPTAVPPTAVPATAVPPTKAPVPATAVPVVPTVAPTAVPTKAPAGPKVLRIGRGTYPDVIDPQKSSYGIEIEVLKLAYEGLLAIDNKGNISAGSAEKWASAPDGKSMTFTIRAGLKRFDGTAMTAKDFEYALKREVDPCVSGKQYTSILYDVKGAEDLDNLDCKKDAAKLPAAWDAYGVKATNDTTLVVTFKNPIGFWHYIAYTWVTYPTDQKAVDKDPENWWTKAAGHNGNGPFKIATIEQSKKITFVPNPTYWRGKPILDRIELIYNVDNTIILEAYKKSELDINANVAPEDVAGIMADATLKSEFLRFPAAITTMISFNNSRKPFDDINVRKAFSAAFDREGWIRDVAKGIGKPYTRWIPPGVPGSQEAKPGVPAFDAKAAVNYLVANGYAHKDSTADKPKVDCAKLGDIKLTYAATPLNHARFQFMAGTYVKIFGCPITLDPVDATVYTAMTKDVKTNPQIGRQGWIQDYPHPQNWLSVYWVCGAFSVRYGYCNKNFDALTAKADQELDFAKSLALYQQAEDLLLSDVPGAGANYTENLALVKPWVIGPKDNTGSSDAEWAGEWGPVWKYDIDLTKVPATYPKQ
jgi:oligopeptide transport system substrate-binding protein